MAKTTKFISYHHPQVAPTEVTEVKSYSTIENLYRALEKEGIHQHRHTVVKTLDDRYTAIFTLTSLRENDINYMGFYSAKGFMTLG